LLSHMRFKSNTCEDDVSFNLTFAQGFDDKPGSNVSRYMGIASGLGVC